MARRQVVAILAILMAAGPAWAFDLWGYWPSTSHVVYYGKLDDRIHGDFRAPFASAAAEWSSKTVFDLVPNGSAIGSCNVYGGPLLDGAEFFPFDCDGFDMSQLYAITECYLASDGRFSECGITFSDYVSWGLYSGTFNPNNPDFRRIALHELGHIVGLDHSSSSSAVMYAFVTATSLTVDDIAGVSANYPGAIQPVISSPSAANPLPGSSVTFNWSAPNASVGEWWVFVGSTPGGQQYLNSGNLGSSTQLDVTGLPTDGSAVYVRLFWRTGPGSWQSADFPFTAASLPPPPLPAATSPAPGTTLPGSSFTLSWTDNGTPVSEWWLFLGSSPGGQDYLNSGSLGASTSTVVSGLPTDGSLVYARLYYRSGGASWSAIDFQYTAANLPPPPPPGITSPAPGSTLAGTTQTFVWTDNGAGISEWWMHVGSSLGGREYLNTGSLGAATMVDVSGLPGDGSAIHVRLFYRSGSGTWSSSDFSFTASSLPPPPLPGITMPSPGSTLSSDPADLAWASNGTPVTEWWLYVGSTPGGKDLFSAGLGAATMVSLAGLPSDGRTLHVRLFYRTGGNWLFVDTTFVAGTAAPPGFSTPSPGSTVSGASVSFSWSAGARSVTEWWLYAGSSLGGKDLFNSGSLGASTSTLVSGLPADGSTLYLRLFYHSAGTWRSLDATFTSDP